MKLQKHANSKYNCFVAELIRLSVVNGTCIRSWCLFCVASLQH